MQNIWEMAQDISAQHSTAHDQVPTSFSAFTNLSLNTRWGPQE